MADSVKQTPLGINLIGALLNNTGLTINPIVNQYVGTSNQNNSYVPGKLITETCLNTLTYAIKDAFDRGLVNAGNYQNLITIGSNTIPALGNSVPNTYVVEDPAGNWTTKAVKYGIQQGIANALPGPANTGYPIISDVEHGQSATWLPYNSTNPNFAVSQWGYLRLHALQAWNEFNWNNDDPLAAVEYTEFLTSINTIDSFIKYNNEVILANQNAKTFGEGTYSNMDDLISADCLGVNLSNELFGLDLDNLGYAIDLTTITEFGFPSNLLRILGQKNAIIQDLALSLLLTGMTDSEIQHLISGEIETPTVEQEQNIYKAFEQITGENLQEILTILQCITPGIQVLTDLLDVKKLFPNSYRTLTIPKYNATLGLPTNSRTYYLVYEGGQINSALTTADMNEYVGCQTPIRTPNTDLTNTTTSTVSKVRKGFGSHLFNVLPRQQAIAAGALTFALRQVKNIDKVNIREFGKIIRSLETTRDLNLVAGTSKPTDDTAIQNVQNKQALGSGPYGTYTYSDFYGSMSGLPYAWEKIHEYILRLQTPALVNVYNQLYLAITYEQATATVQSTETSPGVWTVDSITITNSGGGYGREGNLPTITINGTSVNFTTGQDPSDIYTYGRITDITIPSQTFGTQPTITISSPFGPGFPTINTDIETYITQANSQITTILATSPTLANVLNTYWATLGSQLTIEQRSRFLALSPVDVPKDLFVNLYPATVNIFIDTIRSLMEDTRPHMSAQTLEAISDLSTLGGQCLIAAGRQERNQARLQTVGIELSNNIPSSLSDMDTKTLVTNNTLPAGINNVIRSPLIDRINNNPNIFGNILNGINGFTNPSWVRNIIDDQILYPIPRGRYVPSDTNIIGDYQVTVNSTQGDITSILDGQVNPVVNTIVPAQVQNSPLDLVTISLPYELSSTLSVPLDSRYTASTMLPSSYNLNDAISRIRDCNCDCWAN